MKIRQTTPATSHFPFGITVSICRRKACQNEIANIASFSLIGYTEDQPWDLLYIIYILYDK